MLPRGPVVDAIANLPAVSLMGARIHAITERQCITLILDSLESRQGGSVSTMNLDHLRRFDSDPDFAALYGDADIVTADGMPLIWASRLRGTPLPERLTGSDLITSLSAAAADGGRAIFLLGGDPGTAQQSADLLTGRFPQLRVAGVSSLPDPASPVHSQWGEILCLLEAAQPDIVYVALGSPKQEQLIQSLRHHLPGAWWIGVGIAFSFLAGQVPRAPRWMQRVGLEWLHRLAKEPGRLSKRYLVQGIPFAVKLLGEAALDRGRLSRGCAAASDPPAMQE
jgi:N-acetylglucosaminyldiphosphoundecaprenol N-acetyl-beta-D-mannosaminyltransferase